MSKSSKPKSGHARTALRREELRRNLPKERFDPRVLLERPEYVVAMLIALAFLFVVGGLVIWGREQVLLSAGQVMPDTRVKRVAYSVDDRLATDAAREEAKESSPRIYRLNDSYMERLEAAVLGLPVAVAGRASVDDPEFIAELRESFGLTDEGLAALQSMSNDGEPTGDWQRWVTRLFDRLLPQNPLLDSQEFPIYSTTANHALLLEDGSLKEPYKPDPIVLSDNQEELQDAISSLVARAYFPPAVVPYVAQRLMWDPKTMLIVDAAEEERIGNMRQLAVDTVMVNHEVGEVLYRRGDPLLASVLEGVRKESDEFYAKGSAAEIWLPRLGVLGIAGILAALLGTQIFLAYPRVLRNALRLIAIALLMGGMLAITIVVTAQAPSFLHPAAIGPTLFVSIVILLAYDRRLALFVSAIQAALVTIGLQQGPGMFVLLIAGCGAMVAQMRDVRHRNSIIRATTVTAAVLGVGTVALGLMITPLQIESAVGWRQISLAALTSVVTCFGVGFLVLGILPSIERLFDITTGMTLAELRDPRQSLLRQLQQKAPGTYNHSLQVANIAEAAADAIGADSLLVYVGALYHDIGKLNKPEYFVENQTTGYNKHSKLRPTMSQLVIVGHVKDGIELAREYNLPRPIHHFIESHHGTTLIEYFYHAARTQAEEDAKSTPDEVEFRYPGPKPRTREAGILMLADVVESATRAMPDPNPSRIGSLVRSMAQKRLMDAQFDECELTFRELGLIQDAMISRLCAIHHGRIAYPSSGKEEEATEGAATGTRTVSA